MPKVSAIIKMEKAIIAWVIQRELNTEFSSSASPLPFAKERKRWEAPAMEVLRKPKNTTTEPTTE